MSHYRKKHVKHKISKITPRVSIFAKPIFWLAVFIVVLILSAFYMLFFHSWLQVNDIRISGAQKVDIAQLRNFAFDCATQRYVDLGFAQVSAKSILLADARQMQSDILQRFPLIEKISVQKKYPQGILLGIEERKPIGFFCQDEGGCYLVDNNGVIFEKTDEIPPDMAVVRSLEGGDLWPGKKALNEKMAQAVSRIDALLKENFQISVSEALVTSPLRLDITTSENWKLYLNVTPEENINLQIVKLGMLLRDEISQDARKKLEYIDLRFKDKAYYK